MGLTKLSEGFRQAIVKAAVHACAQSGLLKTLVGPIPMIDRATPLRVLLVDDESYMRVFVGRVLNTSISCTLMEARDGQEAIDLCRSGDPELILLDINMPHVDGIMALAEIRVFNPDTPIVMLTSISEEAVVEKCVARGASHFIRKDVGAGVLKVELQEMLQQFFPAKKEPHEAT